MARGKAFFVLAVAGVLFLLATIVPLRPALAATAIQLSPASGAVGTMVTVTGTNFIYYKGDNVSIFFGGVEIITSPVTVPDSGRLETSFEVPVNTLPGLAMVSVIGPLGSTLANASFMVEAPEIWPDMDSGVVGTSVTIIARGFYVNKQVAFYYKHNGVTTLLGTAVANATGECSCTFVVPSSYAGEHRITAENEIGNRASTTFEVIPQAIVSPTQGSVGDIIAISGTGFAAVEEVSIYLKTTSVAYINSDAFGNFEGVFKVPSMSNDSYAMRIEDASRNRVLMQFPIITVTQSPPIYGEPASGTESVPATFQVSRLSAEPIEVEPNEMVTISALVANTGDLSGSYILELKIDGEVAETKEVSLAGHGSIMVSFTTSEETDGIYAVSIDGLTGRFTVTTPPVVERSKLADFFTSNLSVTPAKVEPGEIVTISVWVANSGYQEGTYLVQLKVDGVVVDTQSVTLAPAASQRVMFTTFEDTAGIYLVDINNLSASFTVEQHPRLNWPLIGGIIGSSGAAASACVFAFTVIIRRRQRLRAAKAELIAMIDKALGDESE